MSSILYDVEARQKLISGVSKLAKAVTTTLGPRGRNVALLKYDEPIVTHDGVTVAKEITMDDEHEELGAKIVRQAAVKTNSLVGDGTTTSIMLADKLIQEGFKVISSGYNPMLVRKGITLAANEVVSYITNNAKPVESEQDITYVASVSCQDKELGEKVSSAFRMVKQGNVIVSESKSNTIDINHNEGLQFNKGFVSQYFVSDEESNKCFLDNPLILLSEDKINSLSPLLPILEEIFESGKRSLLIIADSFSDSVIKSLVLNKLGGDFEVCAIEPPSYGDKRKALLDDIALVTGTKVLSNMRNVSASDMSVEELGSCEKAVISSDKTVLLNGSGESNEVESRINLLRSQIEENEDNSESLKERLNLLSGSVAEIAVGAPSESEMKEKKMLVEDAVNALAAAQKGGIVPGGGTTFLSASLHLETLVSSTENEEIRKGIEIVKNALHEPVRKICYNGGVNGDVILNQLLQEKKSNNNIGYDIVNNKVVDMMETGIIDPALVLTSAITNSASVSTSILTTDAIVVKKKKSDD